MKWPIYGAGMVVLLFYTGSMLATIFQCNPIDHYWNRNSTGVCADGDSEIIVPGAINCVLDALIIFLVSAAPTE